MQILTRKNQNLLEKKAYSKLMRSDEKVGVWMSSYVEFCKIQDLTPLMNYDAIISFLTEESKNFYKTREEVVHIKNAIHSLQLIKEKNIEDDDQGEDNPQDFEIDV